MWRLLRIVLVCLLAVTLPLKGMAAVSMAACGAHSADVEHPMLGDGAESAEPGDDAATVDHADHRHHHGDASKTKCSACAPCCAAAAPGFAGPGLVHAEVSARTASVQDRPLAGVTAARLHRPPISSLR